MDVFQLDFDTKSYRDTPIYRAICRADPQQLLLCLQMGQNVLECDEEFGTTYLHTVVENSNSCFEEIYVQMIYLLSNAGIDVNARDYKGTTPLQLALSKLLPDIIVALIRCGAECVPPNDRKLICENQSPFELEAIHWYQKFEPGLWGAVENNDLNLTERLIRSWCRVMINRNGKSIIRFARENGKKQRIIEILEQNRSSMEFVHATLAGDELRMEELLNNRNIDVYSLKDVSYQPNCLTIGYPRSLREAAADLGHKHVLRLLPVPKSTPENYWGFIKKHVLPRISSDGAQEEQERIIDKNVDKIKDNDNQCLMSANSCMQITEKPKYQNLSKISRIITPRDCSKNIHIPAQQPEPSAICIIM